LRPGSAGGGSGASSPGAAGVGALRRAGDPRPERRKMVGIVGREASRA
jgi:hypothetical protein